jgi:hypothetical protein
MRWTRAVSIVATLLLLAANAFAFLPVASGFQTSLSGVTLALGLVVLVAILVRREPKSVGGRAAAEAVRAPPVPTQANQADAEVISFLAMLQAKGRLVDFLMDDINTYGDAQVGAAARVVHAGCRGVLQEHFRIRSVREETEGATIQVDAGYPVDEYRLIGKIGGSPPIVWNSTDRLPAIAPAEVELK